MNTKKIERIRTGKGFIAALDQSGGSTPKSLERYGISKDQYTNEAEMFDLIHAMRTRVITSPGFTSQHILAVILFEQTMDRAIDNMLVGDYLWEKKGILSFLKVDKGLDELADGVQLMKPMPNLDNLLARAVERNMFGTKMRSVIQSANPEGIRKIVDQQFQYGKQIIAAGLVPIIEPEVDINSADKSKSEELLKPELLKHLNQLSESELVMLKLSIPDQDGFYSDLINHPRVLRVAALSGGYSRKEAVERLARNPGMIASFSRALLEGLKAQQSDEEFNAALKQSIKEIYEASF